ncbi:MAG: dicarboxylate/amino acid:cation symporter [Planctomycetota bacterium]
MSRLALHWQILGGMLLGAAIGLTLNFTVSERNTDVDESELPKGIRRAELHDSSNLITIDLTQVDGTRRHSVIDGTRRTPGSFATLEKLRAHDAQSFDIFHQHGRSWSRWVGEAAQRLGGLFLRMLRMVAVPLVATSLVTGVMGLGHPERLGKMFARTLTYYLVTSLLAIVTGIVLVNIIRPGLGSELNQQAQVAEIASGSLGKVIFEQVETMIPENPIGALAQGSFLSIICFSLAFSIFALMAGGKTAEIVRDFSSAAFEVMMAMTMAIIKLAPLGVLFLMLYVTSTQGVEVFKSLGWYMLTVLFGLMFHSLITLPLIVKFVACRDPLEFAKAMSPALLTAFSSASSNGTLPLTMASAEERAGVSNRISSFVLPLGATINMDGTALYEAVAVLFIAQLYHGHNLPLGEQIIVAFTALLASVGAAGIPHAGLVMMVIILQAVKLPLEMQGIILAVDRVLDMCRTSVNVWSDACGCAVIARMEALDSDGAEEIPVAADNMEERTPFAPGD